MKDERILKAVEILKNGGLVIYPTETCYGVGVMATNEDAVKKLLKYKRRPEGKAVSIAVADRAMAEQYVEINDEADKLYKEFLPGPVTVISKSKGKVVKELESEDGTLGIRIPAYDIAIELVKHLGVPITATSANSAGRKTPYKIQDIYDNISARQKAMIDFVIDDGELAHNPPSTVVNTTKLELQIVRRGELSLGKLVYTKIVKSEREMIQEGMLLIRKYKSLLEEKCLLIMFNAELGAGKTHFTKGIGRELGIKDIIKSPTYSLIKEYPYKLPSVEGNLIHFDAWRVESIDELGKLGIEEYIQKGNVIAVEWAGSTESYFAKLKSRSNLFVLQVQINYITHEERELTIYEPS